eukprot:7386999-Prymnesium_polylepis.1
MLTLVVDAVHQLFVFPSHHNSGSADHELANPGLAIQQLLGPCEHAGVRTTGCAVWACNY